MELVLGGDVPVVQSPCGKNTTTTLEWVRTTVQISHNNTARRSVRDCPQAEEE